MGKQISGIDIEIMRAIAQEGEFFVEYHLETVPVGMTWTEFLLGDGTSRGLPERYDLIAGGGWIDSATRRMRGAQFTVPLVDQGVVLAVKKTRTIPPGIWENAFYWLKPFTVEAWMVIIGLWLFPAILIFSLEVTHNQDFKGSTLQKVFCLIFNRTLLAYFGFGDFEWPSQMASRLIMLLWATIVVVLLASYTANMTAFLVVGNNAEHHIKSMKEFMERGMTVCLGKGWGMNEPIAARWPGLPSVEVPGDQLAAEVVDGSKCQGLLLAKGYVEFMLVGGPPRSAPEGCPDVYDTSQEARRAMRTLRGGGGGAKGGHNSGGGGSSEGDGHGKCDEYGCRLQIVGGTEIALSGVFPAGYSDYTNCRWFPLRVFNTIATHLAQTSKLYDQFQGALNIVSRSPSTMQPMCPAEEGGVEEG